MKTRSLALDLFFRVRKALIGALAGTLITAVLAWPPVALGMIHIPFHRMVVCALLAGFITTALVPKGAIPLLKGALMLLWGMVAFLIGGVGIGPSNAAPKWIWGAFIFGAAYCAILACFSWPS